MREGAENRDMEEESCRERAVKGVTWWRLKQKNGKIGVTANGYVPFAVDSKILCTRRFGFQSHFKFQGELAMQEVVKLTKWIFDRRIFSFNKAYFLKVLEIACLK